MGESVMSNSTDYFFVISREMFERNRERPGKKPEEHDKSHTPRLIVQSKDLFDSSIEGFKDATPCLEISTASERKVAKNGAGQLDGDGHVSLHDVIVCMKYGSWGPKINAAVIEGHKIPKLIIKRFITLHKQIVVIQEMTFENCTIKKYSQDSDLIVFAFCFTKGEDTHIHYDENGRKKGVTSMEFDATTLKGNSK